MEILANDAFGRAGQSHRLNNFSVSTLNARVFLLVTVDECRAVQTARHVVLDGYPAGTNNNVHWCNLDVRYCELYWRDIDLHLRNCHWSNSDRWTDGRRNIDGRYSHRRYLQSRNRDVNWSHCY